MFDLTSFGAGAVASGLLVLTATNWFGSRRLRSIEAGHARQLANSKDEGRALAAAVRESPEWRDAMDREFQRGRIEGGEAGMAGFKSSPEFEMTLALEHAKGKAAGTEEERGKLKISTHPFVETRETFLSSETDVGYELQIFYDGLPIGSPAKHVSVHNVKSKDENITKALEIVTSSLNLLAGAHARVPVSVEQPKRTRVPRKK